MQICIWKEPEMANFLIFLGMAGSKDLIDLLMQSGSEVCVSTTQHPMPVLPKGTAVLKEPETADELATLLQSLQFDCVIDASLDPCIQRYEQRKIACTFSDIRYLRLVNSAGCNEACVYVDSAEKAAGVLSATTGNALLFLGLPELEAFTKVPNFSGRLYPCVKPSPAVIDQCISMGFKQENMIAMDKGFSRELTCAVLRQIKASLLVTKIKDGAGGTEQFMAARDADATAIAIGHPSNEQGFTYPELLELLERNYGISSPSKQTGGPYFPLFVDLQDKKLLVIGGGAAAAKRTETLLRFCHHVSVIAPQFDRAFDRLEAVRIERPYMHGDCKGYDYIFAVADNQEINRVVGEDAKGLHISVYLENISEDSDFLFPDITRKGTVVVGACVPERDKKLRQSLIQAIGERLEAMLSKKKTGDTKEKHKEKKDNG